MCLLRRASASSVATVVLMAGLIACGGGTQSAGTGGGTTGDVTGDGDATTQRAPVTDTMREEAGRLWSEAETAHARDDKVDRRRVLQRLVREVDGTSEAAQARIQLALDALDRGDVAAAQRWLAPLDTRRPAESAARHGHRRVQALAYEGDERYAEAAEAWQEAAKETDDDGARQEATEGTARNQFLDGRPAEARQTLEAGQVAPDRVLELVEGRLTGAVLSSLVARVPPEDPDMPWIAIRHARAACGAADPAGCKAAAQRALDAVDDATKTEAQALLARADAWDQVSARHVGVVLPLSGPYQQIGQAALEGVQIALGGRKDIRLVVRDSKGKAEVAAEQVEKLVLERHVVAILGPVGEHETRAAAAAATRLGVPQVTLTSAAEAVVDAPHTLRVRMSAAEQAVALARHAITTLGVERVGILFPDGTAGGRVMGAFWDEIVRLGGEVRAVEGYEVGTKKFGKVIKRLLAAPKPGRGVHDFDALFIPDDALTIRRLVPFLKYWGLRVKTAPHITGTKKRPAVQLLGAAGWNHISVIDRGDNLTDNAIFVDAFVHDPDDAASDRFARAFFTRYRRKPSTFHAEVRDATALLLAAVEKVEGTDHATRGALWDALLGIKHFRGVTGDATLLADGRVLRKPRLLTIHLDDIRVRLPEEEEAWLRRQGGAGGR